MVLGLALQEPRAKNWALVKGFDYSSYLSGDQKQII